MRPGAIITTLVLVATLAWSQAAAATGDPTSTDAGSRLVVALKAHGPSTTSELGALIASIPGARLADSTPAIGIVVVEVPTSQGRATIARLAAHPLVDVVEDDAAVTTARSRRPNDPRFGEQWGLETLGLPAAWSLVTGGVSIGIIDTGVDDSHEDLSAVTNGGYNAMDGSSRTGDAHGHGTLIAGIAAAHADNNVGVAGACWRCEVVPMRVFDDEGRAYASRLADAIVWAADRRLSVVNMSLVVTEDHVALRRAVRYASDRGSLLVAAAGNDGANQRRWPAAYPEVLAVGGTDPRGQRYSWSNHGSWVDVTAPGCSTSTTTRGGYGSACGTSVAAPHVAGLAALVRTRHPGASDLVARWAVQSTADGAERATSRHGAVDALAAVRALDGAGGPPAHRDVRRVAGSDRVATAAALSATTFDPAAVDAVVVARADDYPDALAGVPLAHHVGGPLLLTASDRLSAPTAAELRRLEPRRVYLLGGTAALDERVAREIREAGFDVRRIAGADRWETAARVAYRLVGAEPPERGDERDEAPQDGDGGADGILPDPFGDEPPISLASAGRSVYIVEGSNADAQRGWPDAVAAGWVAARDRGPLLLVQQDAIPASTLEALELLEGVTTAWIVGGEAAVSREVEAVLADTGLDVRRLAGADRFETSQRTASHAADRGYGGAGVVLATGLDFPDALAAGAAAAHLDHTLLLSHPRHLDRAPSTRRWIADERTAIRTVTLVGGEAALSAGIAQDAGLLLDGW